MSRKAIWLYTVVLVCLGAGWGFTQPMTKLSVSSGHQHFGLIFWQLVIGTALMGAIALARGISLPMQRRHLEVYAIIAAIGTLIPNSFSYQAAAHLPSGVISILYSMIPMLAFPIALGLALDRFEWRRFCGLALGLVAVLLISQPWNSTEALGPAAGFWIIVVILTCMCYAFEGNYVARWGTQGLSALQVLFGASLVGMVAVLPLALWSGQWISPVRTYGVPEYALIAGSLAHVLVYTGYVWLVGRAGPVFAVQVSYLVTLTGVFWAWALLGEHYSASIWISLALMLGGMYLVRPRPART